MNRTLFAAGFLCGLLGPVLAVPTTTRASAAVPEGAPPPRTKFLAPKLPAVGLEVAPPPRAKFLAPKLPSTYEVLVFNHQRPVRITVQVQYEGKSINDLWRDRFKRAFDFCDRDADEYLCEKEIKFALSDQVVQLLVGNGFYQPAPSYAAPTLAKLDKDGDGKVSFEEFIASYTLTAGQMIRAVNPESNNTYNINATVTEVLFKLLDTNGDDKLTKNELAAIEKWITTHDSDEDECLSLQEIAPDLYPQFGRPNRPVTPPVQTSPVAASQIVAVYEVGRIPGTVTQRVIQKYDKNGDFELTQAEIGFDTAQFQALDRDGNGRLDSEELDVWRSGEPDIALILSFAKEAAHCIANVTNKANAAARGIVVKQISNNRVVLHVGSQAIEWTVLIPNNRFEYEVPSLSQQFGPLFTRAAGGKNHFTAKDLEGSKAVNLQILKVIFEAADRNGDGKVTKVEFDNYFELLDSFRSIGLSLTPTVHTPTLFNLLDENRNGRLSVRELRTAWKRLIALEEPGAEAITKNIIQPLVNIQLFQTYVRFNIRQPEQLYYNSYQAVSAPTRGPLWFRKMDRNGDGDLSRIEYLGTKAEFDAIDTDGDSLISLEEAEAWDKKMREKENTPQPEK